MNYSVKKRWNSFLLPGKILLSCILLLCGAMQISAQTYFRTDTGVPYIPVLSAAPTPASVGAIYINSADQAMYWYDGTQWVLAAYKIAPDGTLVKDLTSSTGRVWMDRNLGASRAAVSSTDYLAYGSLYQWCRATDGHEKIIWTSASTGTPVNNGTTTTLSTSTTAPNSLFIVNPNSPNDWLSTQQTNGNLWWSGTATGANNPCPAGYHVPTYAEWNVELSAGITNAATVFSRLKVPTAGYRLAENGAFDSVGSSGWCWTTTPTPAGNTTWGLYFGSAVAGLSYNLRVWGFSVRCIKN